ncbi:MAG: hypothetical protein R3B70_47950 [Polyangiaceae bacterium]
MNAQTNTAPLSSRIAEGAARTLRSRWTMLGFLALMLTPVGCVARASAGTAVVVDEPVVEVSTVPVAVETYPRHYYHGHYVYLVGGRWYYRAHGRWVVYRTEPRALATARVRIQASAKVKAHGHAHHGPEVASPPPHGKKKGHHKHH